MRGTVPHSCSVSAGRRAPVGGPVVVALAADADRAMAVRAAAAVGAVDRAWPAPLRDRDPHHVLVLAHDELELVVAQVLDLAPRVDPGAEQRLVADRVADPGDDLLVEHARRRSRARRRTAAAARRRGRRRSPAAAGRGRGGAAPGRWRAATRRPAAGSCRRSGSRSPGPKQGAARACRRGAGRRRRRTGGRSSRDGCGARLHRRSGRRGACRTPRRARASALELCRPCGGAASAGSARRRSRAPGRRGPR